VNGAAKSVVASLFAMSIAGCGDADVAVCVGGVQFCNEVFAPYADAGPDQIVDAGDVVILDGSDSRGGVGSIESYSWAQTSGPNVALEDADRAQATFIAPDVAADVVLTFRLTVVDDTDAADTNSTQVTVRRVAPAMVALQLFDGPLRPPTGWPQDTAGCPGATDALPRDEAAAQLGLWLAGRTLAIAKGIDSADPSMWLDMVRVLVSERAAAPHNTAGRIESFGFMLFATALPERDPALRQAIVARLKDAPMLDDPAALLGGRVQVRTHGEIAIEPTPDPAQAIRAAGERLLTARSGCVAGADALALTAAGLAVIAQADAADAQ
jgi:hypothetical protein